MKVAWADELASFEFWLMLLMCALLSRRVAKVGDALLFTDRSRVVRSDLFSYFFYNRTLFSRFGSSGRETGRWWRGVVC